MRDIRCPVCRSYLRQIDKEPTLIEMIYKRLYDLYESNRMLRKTFKCPPIENINNGLFNFGGKKWLED